MVGKLLLRATGLCFLFAQVSMAYPNVVVSTSASASEALAASTLRAYLGNMSERVVTPITDADAGIIAVGYDAALKLG